MKYSDVSMNRLPSWISVAVMAEEQDTIKVGVPCATTGPFASTGQVQLKAVQLAVDEYNAKSA